MRFSEVDLFGVYLAPIALMMLGAWLLLLPLRRIADHFGLMPRVWHPTLFWFAAYIILLAVIVQFAAVARLG